MLSKSLKSSQRTTAGHHSRWKIIHLKNDSNLIITLKLNEKSKRSNSKSLTWKKQNVNIIHNKHLKSQKIMQNPIIRHSKIYVIELNDGKITWIITIWAHLAE